MRKYSQKLYDSNQAFNRDTFKPKVYLNCFKTVNGPLFLTGIIQKILSLNLYLAWSCKSYKITCIITFLVK